mgnify:CR=1 FL=1
MNRNKKLLSKRVKQSGLFFEIKKARGLSSKRAIIEISQALGVSVSVTTKDLVKYRKEVFG